jgi:tRNA (adenine37-N6)-methyltransferase
VAERRSRGGPTARSAWIAQCRRGDIVRSRFVQSAQARNTGNDFKSSYPARRNRRHTARSAGCRIYFVGRIRTPWVTRDLRARHGDPKGPECKIELDRVWKRALSGLVAYPLIQVLYGMHQARRDLLVQVPRVSGRAFGTFALRSPVRPNPIASSIVDLMSIQRNVVTVRGLDCVDGTPLIDLKPVRD